MIHTTPSKKKPRLLLVGTDSTHTVNYYHLIKDYFSDIQVITTKGAGRWGNIPVAIANMSLKNPWRVLQTLRLFRRLIRQNKPDVIHVHQAGTPAFYTLMARPDVFPVVVTAWGSDVLQVPSISWLHKALVRFILRRAEALTADSQFMALEMKRLAVPVPIEVVVANFGIPKLPETGPKEKLIYSNRLHKKLYRIDEVLKAFHRFLQVPEHRDWELVVAGQGEETPALVNLAEALGIADKVSFVGFVDQAVNLGYYARASIFISIPESDATSISLLEALAAGCCPLVSNLPSNIEWIIHGENGIVVEDMNADFISDALTLNYDKLLKMNRELVHQKATIEVNRSIFQGIYDKILSKP